MYSSKKLFRITWFVTSACNFNCVHCFYPRHGGELKDDEILAIFNNRDLNFRVLTLSGGEPFLKNNLIDLVTQIVQSRRSVRYVNVVSNGYFTKHIVDFARRFTASTNRRLGIQLSLYGFEKTQHRITGVDSFARVIQTLDELVALKEARLSLSVMTVLIDQEPGEVLELNKFLKQRYQGRVLHKVEVFRDSSFSKKCAIKRTEFLYNKKVSAKRNGDYIELLKHWSSGAALLTEKRQRYLRKLFVDFLEQNEYRFNCVMGRKSIVILSNGDVPVCEYSAVVANLREYDYNLPELLNSAQFRGAVENIRNSFCFHPCALTDSLFYDPRLMWRFLKV